jgi:hypothetical protein
MKWALPGIVAGGIASIWVTRLLQSFLFGVGSADAVSWIARW